MSNILTFKKPTDRDDQTVVVDVTFADGMFTAECTALHLVTEAVTFEALTERVWELAPDMIDANNLDISPDSLRLSFMFEQSAQDHRLAL